jgi:predicted PurR-regulated permease PerM
MNPSGASGVGADVAPRPGRLGEILDRRAEWIGMLIVLATIAAGFVVLEFLARYFEDYLHIVLIFFFAWLLAFLVAPPADWLQRHLRHLPRPVAVLAVIVPVVVVGSLVIVWVVASVADSFVGLADSLPALTANPPPFLTDLQTWLTDRGINVDVVTTFHTIVSSALAGMVDLMIGLFGGAFAVVGTFVDGLLVVSLAVFMVIDSEKILRFGLGVIPPDRREDAMKFRHGIGTAVAGFIRSQLWLGGVYGIWAIGVGLVFGLPYVLATAVLSALIMAIPIYGPYVSWLPPVLVAALVRPESVVLVATVMLVGWFIDMNILAPLFRAGALQLHPIVVAFAFLLGGQLGGALGSVIAIPLAAVIQAFVMAYLDDYRTKRGWPPPDDPASDGPPDPASSGAVAEEVA